MKVSTDPRAQFGALVDKMTNHERNLWARAGYPGLMNKDIKALLPHAKAAQLRLTGKWTTLKQALKLGQI